MASRLRQAHDAKSFTPVSDGKLEHTNQTVLLRALTWRCFGRFGACSACLLCVCMISIAVIMAVEG